jgi:hypothetical protein
MLDDSTGSLADRIQRLEVSVRDLQREVAAQGVASGVSDDVAAQRTLDGVATALQVLAARADSRLLFFASASARWAAASGPERLDAVVGDEQLPAVVALARIFADADRVKLLQTLVVETGSSMTRLVGVSGEPESVVRAHLEAMHAAGLVVEPSPRNYQLTPIGEQVVKMVFWGAWRASLSAT